MKRLYYELSNGADIRMIMSLTKCVEFIKSEMDQYNYPDDAIEFTLSPRWLTKNEYIERLVESVDQALTDTTVWIEKSKKDLANR